MRPTYTIEDLFATPARARVLRALARAQGPLSVRGVGHLAGVSHTSASSVLRDLESMQLVHWRQFGRARTYWLLKENAFIRHMLLPAIEGERVVVEDLMADLVEVFGANALSLILFGSWAYGEQTDQSDIDILAIAADERRKQMLEETDLREGARLTQVYSSYPSLLVFTLAEARQVLPISTSALRLELESTGIILHGLGPREWGIDEPEVDHAGDSAPTIAPVPQEGA